MDVIAANSLGRALYAALFVDPTAQANTARFTFLDPAERLPLLSCLAATEHTDRESIDEPTDG